MRFITLSEQSYMMNVLFFAPTTPPNNRQQTFFSLRAISAAVEPLRSLLGTILVCETYPMGGTESKREEDPGGDTEVSSPDIKLEDAEPQQNRFSNRGKSIEGSLKCYGRGGKRKNSKRRN